jgi:valyl-tRNA synthetase
VTAAYDPEDVEAKWRETWDDSDVYDYDGDPETDPDTVYSIDSPPPTTSGEIHWGNTYGFVLMDMAARFHRMNGDATFFPYGHDDNGIASERLTERELDVQRGDMPREAFAEKVDEVCREYEGRFREYMRRIGLSVDWDHTYRTIDDDVQRVSQLSFVDLHEQDREYREEAPAMWCPDCETAISQVEMEDEERQGHYHDIAFDLADSDESVTISTTRPELLPACVAVFVHPDDDRTDDLPGRTAEVPLFGQQVPIYEDERVDPEEGSGVVMCCTFGDKTDIEWYQAHDLPLRVAIDESGTMTERAGDYQGLSTEAAREAIVADLEDAGHLLDRRSIEHTVQVHERSCDAPVEFLVTEQWYVELLDHRERYLDAGEELDWYPEKMHTRYEHWVEGLEWDWLISRQRDAGIPFPVWYCGDCDEPVLADKTDLPVDPEDDDPPVEACPECGHEAFRPETDVLDTWATSSLTPLINAGWHWDPESGEYAFDNPELYPMTMRPQGHDIISFWLFHTVVKCLEHTGEVPFDETLINGHVLDENREKMSKSRGNVVSPTAVMDEFAVDAARYWTAGTSIGDDVPFKREDVVAGEQLLQKLWNASRLVDDLAPTDPAAPDDLAAVDEWLLAELDATVAAVTSHFEAYELAKARNRLRTFFWNTFCDDYLEIAKQRLRDGDDRSAAYALRAAHRRILQLFAPYLPHLTEECWQAQYVDGEWTSEDSIHRSAWPTPTGHEADRDAGRTAMAAIGALRKYKTEHGLALNAPLDTVRLYGDVAGFEAAIADAMHVDHLETPDGPAPVSEEIVDISLDYETLGPKLGGRLGAIENAIDDGQYAIEDDHLHAAGETIAPDDFEAVSERTLDGDGELLEAGDALLVVDAATADTPEPE